MIKAVLFDLDGTLLPMDNDVFVKTYFGLLAKKFAPFGYEPEKFINYVWEGTAAMVKNDGADTNENVFWKVFSDKTGGNTLENKQVFSDFYENEFNESRIVCGYNEKLVNIVHELKAKNIRIGLATNPLFPAVATESRIRWAGFQPNDFEFYTTYENIGFCKPNPMYYAELLKRTGLKAEECLMVGNDAKEDSPAADLGMKFFLLTDYLINKDNRDISAYKNGNADDLYAYIKSII